MLIRGLSILALFVCACCTLNAQTAEEIIAKSFEVYGGKAAYENSKTYYSEFLIEAGGDKTNGKYWSDRTNGNKSMIDFSEKDGLVKMFADTSIGGWIYQKDLKENKDTMIDVPKEQVVNISMQIAQMLIPWRGFFFHYEEDSVTLELAGKERVGRNNCYKVKFIGKEDYRRNYFIDMKTNQVLKISWIFKGQDKSHNIDIMLKEPKTFDNILIPTEIELLVDDNTQQKVTYSKIENNKPIDAKVFEKPTVTSK